MPRLFPHQEAGVAFMRAREAAGKNWGNFDVCGMGKSFQLGRLVEGDGAGAETLLVCPASIVGQWRAVAKRFGVGDRLTVASYACVANARDAFRALAARHWHRAVFDEAHFLGQLTRDRHGQPKLSKRSVHARRIRARFLGVLTATPCTGTHESFECLADFLGMDASELAGAGSIRRRLCDVPAFARQFPWLTRVEHFRCVTRKSVAERRRAVEDYVDRNLPPPHPVTGVRKGRAARKRVGSMLASFSLELVTKDGPGAAPAAGRGIKERTVLALALQRPHNAILIFTTYESERELLVRSLEACCPERAVTTIHGRVPQSKRRRIFEAVQRPTYFAGRCSAEAHAVATAARVPRPGAPNLHARCVARIAAFLPKPGPITVMQRATGSTGLNLQMYRTVIFANVDWSPSDDEQAVSRVCRFGQKHDVDAHWVYKDQVGSYDLHVLSRRLEKKRVIRNVLQEDDELERNRITHKCVAYELSRKEKAEDAAYVAARTSTQQQQ